MVGAFEPPLWESVHVSAMQALERGQANSEQQKIALAWIINGAAATYDEPYRPGEAGRRDTDFALGRAFVGRQIVKLMRLQLGVLPKREPRADAHDPTAGQ